MRPIAMVYDMPDNRARCHELPPDSEYDATTVKSEHNIVNMMRVFDKRHYPVNYALWHFMDSGVIPATTPEGDEIDLKEAVALIRSYNRACDKCHESHRVYAR